MKYIIDRIEGEYAVCEAEDQSMIDIPFSELPSGTKEGDHISFEDGIYTTLPADDSREKRIRRLMDDLWGTK